MAGLGTRFKNSQYLKEKYEIEFYNKTLFEWSVESLLNFKDNEFIFVTRNFPRIQEFIIQKTEKMGIKNVDIEVINRTTRGQAETALLARRFFKRDDCFMVYNIDTYVEKETLRPEYIHGNDWIPVFSAPGDRWSFVEADEDGKALRTTEKIRISDNCCIGLYYFDSFFKFAKLVEAQVAKNQTEKEWYIAPLYNDFIKMENTVYIHKIVNDSVIVLGTPEDLLSAGHRFKKR